MTHDRHLRLYLRAEPSEEGRDLLLIHRRRLRDLLASLEITARVIGRDDFHRTELFLDSPEVWERAFASVGIRTTVSAADLLELVNVPAEDRDIRSAIPWRYEPFFTGGAHVSFVLRLRSDAGSLGRHLLQSVHERLRAWEAAGRIPPGAATALERGPTYPLARERSGGKPHITLVRGRASPERHRDVARSLRTARLASTAPIPLLRIDVRAVRSSHSIAPFAPLPGGTSDSRVS